MISVFKSKVKYEKRNQFDSENKFPKILKKSKRLSKAFDEKAVIKIYR
jgi:hypothetical protein